MTDKEKVLNYIKMLYSAFDLYYDDTAGKCMEDLDEKQDKGGFVINYNEEKGDFETVGEPEFKEFLSSFENFIKAHSEDK